MRGVGFPSAAVAASEGTEDGRPDDIRTGGPLRRDLRSDHRAPFRRNARAGGTTPLSTPPQRVRHAACTSSSSSRSRSTRPRRCTKGWLGFVAHWCRKPFSRSTTRHFAPVASAARKWATPVNSPRWSVAAGSISFALRRPMTRRQSPSCCRSRASGGGAPRSICFLRWDGRIYGRLPTSACRSRSATNSNSDLALVSSRCGGSARRGGPGVRWPPVFSGSLTCTLAGGQRHVAARALCLTALREGP